MEEMTSNCSYIGDPVLPKDSLLYTKFMVLNTINNLKIEGKPIPVSLKQEIYTDCFMTGNNNLMELLSNDFDFTRGAMEERKKKLGEVTPKLDDYLDDSYASPAIRRSIRQVMEIVTEITKIIGGAPIKIFIEVTREHSDKHEPVKSRKDQLIALYKAAGFDSSELLERLESKETDASLRGDKLFLYYTQQGKCMYSGRPIDLNRIDTDYDIDHIYPRSKTKDDSIDNRVLVERELNKTKSDSYPLSDKLNITPNVRSFWKMLNQKGLISDKKYERLTRNTPLTDDELFAFVNRQLVETSQSCKIIAELLADRFKGSTRIVYVKAGLVSDFRQSQRIIPKTGEQRMAHDCRTSNGTDIYTEQDPLFIKCREVNDFHHAKDNYIFTRNRTYTFLYCQPLGLREHREEHHGCCKGTRKRNKGSL